MKHLYHAVAPLLAVGVLTACQQAPAAAPSATMSMTAGQGILVVNAHTAGTIRRVQQATVPLPDTFTDVAEVRIYLKKDGVTMDTYKIDDPNARTISAAFRNLNAQTTYTVVAEAYLIDPDDVATAAAVASDSETITIYNETAPSLLDMTLTLPNRYFDSKTTNEITIEDGEWEYPASGEEDIEATPLNLA